MNALAGKSSEGSSFSASQSLQSKACGVCQENVSKYKCPICTLPYCSLPCYKKHKENPCEKPAPPPEPPKQDPPPLNIPEDDESLLSDEQLAQLEHSDKVRQYLKDPRVCQLISEITSAEDAERRLDRAREDPEFEAFAQTLIDTVRPFEKNE
ncbi:uncharacterized protein VTP21DRAFT_3748 [Calcarisporiella thermophila]|uniref:uncharacterized protein n=1 Tax=Calcarisporiella thermophila TaxID=911321 RepID=UPI0037434559